jgi:hypothetical protein
LEYTKRDGLPHLIGLWVIFFLDLDWFWFSECIGPFFSVRLSPCPARLITSLPTRQNFTKSSSWRFSHIAGIDLNRLAVFFRSMMAKESKQKNRTNASVEVGIRAWDCELGSWLQVRQMQGWDDRLRLHQNAVQTAVQPLSPVVSSADWYGYSPLGLVWG